MERVARGGRGGAAGGRGGLVDRSGARPCTPLEGDIERPRRDGARPHDPDWWLLVTIVALVVFGTVMIFSATFARDLPEGGDPLRFLRKQLVWVAIGGSAFLVTMRIDYHVWRRFSVVALLGAILLLMLVLVPGLGVGADEVGARRWLNLGPLPQFQPSELAKAALVLYLADWLTTKGERLRDWRTGAVPFTVLLGTLILLVMLEPDLGTSALLAIIGGSMFLVAGADLRQFALLIGSGAFAFVGLALSASYRRDRLALFMKSDEELRLLGDGWQLWQARLATGSGGLVGVGLGASRIKYGWLPEAHTDSIFAVVGEELGLLGCGCLLALFFLLAVRGYRVAARAPDRFGALLATGIVSWIAFQALINIGGITTTIPFTGVPLPFISYGGTSFMVVTAVTGVLVNISCQTRNTASAGAERGTRNEGETNARQ